MAELAARGETAEVLFWVGCAGSFDERAKKVTKAVAKLLNQAGVSFAVLGAEESCSGDPAGSMRLAALRRSAAHRPVSRAV